MFDDTQYLQFALCKFNGGVGWYSWKKEDDKGNKIPNSDRMQYKYIKIIKKGATMPTEAQVNEKIQEIKDQEKQRANKKKSALAKLKKLGLDEDEIKALF
jgi:hypothetical protein